MTGTDARPAVTDSRRLSVDDAFALAGRLARDGRPAEARSVLQKIRDVPAESAAGASAFAMAARRAGLTDEAVYWFRRAIDLEPGEPAHLGNLGNLYRAAGRYEEAIDCYRSVLEAVPASVAAHNNLGLALAAQGRPSEALAAYRAGLGIDPNSAELRTNLGVLLMDRGDVAAGLAECRSAAAADPGSAAAANNLGMALRRVGDDEESIAWFRKALDNRSDHGEAQFNLGNALRDLGRPDEAADAYARALDDPVVGARAARALAEILISAGDLGRAESVLEDALRRWPGDVSIAVRLAEALCRAGRAADAGQVLTDLLVAEPDNADLLRALGEVHLRRQDWKESLAVYRQVLAVDPDCPVAKRHLALLEGGSTAGPLADYVGGVFDDYADTFDSHLVGTLRYRGHRILAELTAAAISSGHVRSLLDLGCGTGLLGAELKKRLDIGLMVGIDLSSKMVAQARAKGLYDEVETAELQAYLDREERTFDLVSAGDVLVYVGELAPTFAAVRRRMEPGGHFCFTAEDSGGEDFVLQATARYAHGRRYLENLAPRHGFAVTAFETREVRMESGRPVYSHCVVLRAA